MATEEVILDPLYMAAALSLTSPNQDAALDAIAANAKSNRFQLLVNVSRYVIAELGMARIEAQARRIERGEISVPAEVLAFLICGKPM